MSQIKNYLLYVPAQTLQGSNTKEWIIGWQIGTSVRDASDRYFTANPDPYYKNGQYWECPIYAKTVLDIEETE